MIANRNIVCIASSWFDHPTSKHHVMRRLARENNVLWVNFHASRRPQLTTSDTRLVWRRLRRAWGGPRLVEANINVFTPLLIPMPESRVARFVNGRILARRVTAALRKLTAQPTQLWLFTPDMPELIPLLGAERVVYYCVDDFAAFEGYNTALIEKLEQRTMAASDAVIATSQKLYDDRRDRHPNVHFVPHGVDYEHFATATRLTEDDLPADIRDIPHPIFGYMGLISDYVDLELIARTARARRDWSFVLLGDARCSLDAVSSLPNVHRLGSKSYESLPAYCRAFDVGLIPFRINRLTRAVNPIKLREYLAAGLPVVSSPMLEVLRYAPAVQTAETPTEFLGACERALELAINEAPADLQQMVRREGWAARVETLSQIVMNGGPTTPAPEPTPPHAVGT